jgi:hypothetical protein
MHIWILACIVALQTSKHEDRRIASGAMLLAVCTPLLGRESKINRDKIDVLLELSRKNHAGYTIFFESKACFMCLGLN